VASTPAPETTAYRDRELPMSRRRSAHLLVALEEDRTGRQPVSLPPNQSWSPADEPDSLDKYAHVFLDDQDDGSTIGYARVDLASETAELAMRPDSFQSVSTLARGVRSHFGIGRFWAKGRESAAAGIEGSVVRSLTIMTQNLPVAVLDVPPEPDVHLRPFNPTTDTDRWLQMNAEIFADLPDQASVTRDELDALQKATWFDPAGFLIAESVHPSRTEMMGFHWTKVDSASRFRGRVSGEVFVLGVLARFAGAGVATALLDSGLRRINSSGVNNVHLYVESENERAHHFYELRGFSDADRDQLLELRS
jgi:mycothiol synthase